MHQDPQSPEVESFRLTIDNLLAHSQLWPIMFDANQIWSQVSNDADTSGVVHHYQQMIDSVNEMTMDVLIYGVKVFFTGLRIPWKLKKDSLMNFVMKKVESKLLQMKLTYPEFLVAKFEKYQEALTEQTTAISQGMYEAMEECVFALINQKLSATDLQKDLKAIMEHQLQRITYDLYDFCHLAAERTNRLFLIIKRGVHSLLQYFYSFIYTMSFFGNVEMDTLNNVMKNNTCLANIDTYKVMQVELSKRIYKHVRGLLEEQTFYRPEFYQFSDHILFQTLKNFFHYAEQVNRFLDNNQHPQSFPDMLTIMGIDNYQTPLINVQVISNQVPKIIEHVKADPEHFEQLTQYKDNNLLYEDVTNLKSGLNLYEQGRSIVVEKSQDVKSRVSNQVGIVVQFGGPFKEFGSFFIGLRNKCLFIQELSTIDPAKWGPISSVEKYDQLPFTEFLGISSVTLHHSASLNEEEQRFKSSASLDQQNQQGISYRTKQMILNRKELISVITINYDEYLANPEVHHKHLQVPKKPIRYGTSTELLAGKTLGTGLGYLIVNCLDEDMPWDDKLKDAGYTTMTLGSIALVSSRLPVVGIIIQSVILAYAVTVTVNNKVVNSDEKAKNLGHLAIQIGIGIVCIVGGHILIPFHFWGAFFGGLSAGIFIGLYSKFVVPKTMVSLQKMIEKLDRRITPDGCIYYSPIVIEIMKINEKFFLESKPAGYSKSDWLTLTLVCLVHEVHYMYQLLMAKHMAKITKKLESKPNDEKLKLEMEEMKIHWIQNDVKTHDWKECRKYIAKHKLSILDNHERIQEFLEGMIENFKIP